MQRKCCVISNKYEKAVHLQLLQYLTVKYALLGKMSCIRVENSSHHAAQTPLFSHVIWNFLATFMTAWFIDSCEGAR